MILLRLAEDVITFQTLPAQRRRDIQQTLTQNMESIFSFLLAILQLHVDEYRKLVNRQWLCLVLKKMCRGFFDLFLLILSFCTSSRKEYRAKNCR